MIGDSYKDIIPAFNLGMDSMLVLTGNGKNDQNKFDKIKNLISLLKICFWSENNR